jgi:hypothetical protein
VVVKKVGEGAACDFAGGGAGGWETATRCRFGPAGSSEREQVFDVVWKKVSAEAFFFPRGELLRANFHGWAL